MKQTNTLSPASFLRRLFLFAFILLFLAGSMMAVFDPYQHYRQSPVPYVVHPRFCLSGLTKHADYDAILIGSSMAQNFNIPEMEEVFGGEILKATKGGLTPWEALKIMRWAQEASKASRIYLTLEPIYFNSNSTKDDYFPDYLANNTVTDDLSYLFGYEAWTLFLPIDLAIIGGNLTGITLPSSIQKNTNPDLSGRWAESAVYPGEEALVNNYLNGEGRVSAQRAEGMAERMKQNFDRWLSSEPFDADTEYVYFSAPYSILYWTHTKREGSFDALMEFRTYFFERLNEYDNVKVYDFQALPAVFDLSLYKDVSHYSHTVNDEMVRLLAAEECLATQEAVSENTRLIRAGVDALCAKYPALMS